VGGKLTGVPAAFSKFYCDYHIICRKRTVRYSTSNSLQTHHPPNPSHPKLLFQASFKKRTCGHSACRMWGNTINPKPDAALRNQDTSLAVVGREKRKEKPELDGRDGIWKQRMVCRAILCTDIWKSSWEERRKKKRIIYLLIFVSHSPTHLLLTQLTLISPGRQDFRTVRRMGTEGSQVRHN